MSHPATSEFSSASAASSSTDEEEIFNPENLIIYRCKNNGSLVLKLESDIQINQEKKQAREKKYERFAGAVFHILFEPSSAVTSSQVQEIRDAQNLESLSHPFTQENTWIFRYQKDRPLDMEDFDNIMKNLFKACSEAAYLKLELTFHSTLFLSRSVFEGMVMNEVLTGRIQEIARAIRSTLNDQKLNLQAAEVKLNSCNSAGNIADSFHRYLNHSSGRAEASSSKTQVPINVKSAPGLMYIEMYDALLPTDKFSILERDPSVRGLAPQESAPFEDIEKRAQDVIRELCEKKFISNDLSSKNGRRLPLFRDHYVIIPENPSFDIATRKLLLAEKSRYFKC